MGCATALARGNGQEPAVPRRLEGGESAGGRLNLVVLGLLGRLVRSARRMIAQARVVGRRVRLSLFSSTTTLAPNVANSSSSRTHAYSSAAGRCRVGGRRS
jgi:hypothetical protein